MNQFIVRPITNLLLFFYRWLGQETILAVVIVTAMLRLALTPLTRQKHLSKQKTQRRRQEFQANMAALQEKYKDSRSKLAEEQFKLYQGINANPLEGCLLLLIQFPLLIGVYRGIIGTLAVTPIRLLALSRQIYPWAADLSTLIPLNSRFLWMDLALRDPYFVLPVLVLLTSWLRQRLTTPPDDTAEEKGLTSYLNIFMPLLSAFIAAGLASGLAIYILTSSSIGIAEYFLFQRNIDTLMPEPQEEEAQAETVAPPVAADDSTELKEP